MARPYKSDEIQAFERIGVRIPALLRVRIARLARDHGRVLSDEIRAALEEHVARVEKQEARKG